MTTNASKPSPTRSMVKRLIGASLVMLVIGTCSAPRIALFPVFQEGNKLIPLIEDYKKANGSYPESLDRLGVDLRFDSTGSRRLEYYLIEEGQDFILWCSAFGFLARDVYDSRTKRWRSLD